MEEFGELFINMKRTDGGYNHQNTHRENPGEESALKNDPLTFRHTLPYRQYNKTDQCHTCYPVCFKTVRRRSNTVSCIITCTIGNDTRIAWIVLLYLKIDLH